MSWQTRPLSEIADFVLGKMLDQAKNRGEPRPYLANVNVRWGDFDLSDLREMRFEPHEVERYGLKAGDIVMCEGGEPGRCALWKGQRKGMMIQKALHRIRPHAGLDSTFLYYAFLNIGKQNGFAPFFTGATIKHLPREQLARVPIRFPEWSEQKAIAVVLSAYDDLIATNQRRIALLEDAARRLYREWFVHLRFPGHESVPVKDGVPEGWSKGSAYDFISILSGGTPKTGIEHYWGGDIPFFTPKDSPDAFYVLRTEKTLTESGLASCNSRLYAKDTTFITARGTVGKVALAQKPMAMNQSCYALVPKQDYDSLFLFAAIKDAVEHFKQVAVGGVFDAIVVDTFKVIPFVLPDAVVTRAFGNAVRPLFQQVETLLLQNTQLAQARDLLLPKLMSGHLDVSGIALLDEVVA